jgi:non-ribosomal peptide synthetase component F
MSSLLDNFDEDEKKLYSGSLRLVLLSGDLIPLNLPKRIREVFGFLILIISLGGATEGSIWSISYPINESKKKWKSIPYGRPLSNQSIFVLDSNLHPCPPPMWLERSISEGYASQGVMLIEQS